jgi:hypothetical protein
LLHSLGIDWLSLFAFLLCDVSRLAGEVNRLLGASQRGCYLEGRKLVC